MIELNDIPDRITVRTKHMKLQLHELSKILNENDISKLLEFAAGTSLHHYNFVTSALVSPEWDVIFQRKRKTQPVGRKVY